MKKMIQTLLATALIGSSLMAMAETMTYRLDGRYPGIASEWIEVDYFDSKPQHINRVSYWNTVDDRDTLDIVEQNYVAYDGGGAYTGQVRFPMSGDVYQYAINSAGFVLTDGTADMEPAVFEQE